MADFSFHGDESLANEFDDACFTGFGDDKSIHTDYCHNNVIENTLDLQSTTQTDKRSKVQRSSLSTPERNISPYAETNVNTPNVLNSDVLQQAAIQNGIPLQARIQNPEPERGLNEILQNSCIENIVEFTNEAENNYDLDYDFLFNDPDFNDSVCQKENKLVDESQDIHHNDNNAFDDNNKPGPSNTQSRFVDDTQIDYQFEQPSKTVEQPKQKTDDVIIKDPMASTETYFNVEPAMLSSFLQKHGTPVTGRIPTSKAEIDRLVARYCDVKELSFMNEGKKFCYFSSTLSVLHST